MVQRFVPGTVAGIPDGPVLVSVSAPWCHHCRALRPVVEEQAAAAGLDLLEVRVDDNPTLVEDLGVRSVPTVIGMSDGREVGRLVGSQSREALASLCSATISGEAAFRRGVDWPTMLTRGISGAALVLAGLLLSAVVLVVLGVALLGWCLHGSLKG